MECEGKAAGGRVICSCGGGGRIGGFDFFCELGLFKMPGSLIQIIGLITCLLGRESYPETEKLRFRSPLETRPNRMIIHSKWFTS
jgi:hypothetical protein